MRLLVREMVQASWGLESTIWKKLILVWQGARNRGARGHRIRVHSQANRRAFASFYLFGFGEGALTRRARPAHASAYCGAIRLARAPGLCWLCRQFQFPCHRHSASCPRDDSQCFWVAKFAPRGLATEPTAAAAKDRAAEDGDGARQQRAVEAWELLPHPEPGNDQPVRVRNGLRRLSNACVPMRICCIGDIVCVPVLLLDPVCVPNCAAGCP